MTAPQRALPITGLGTITNGYTNEEGRLLTQSAKHARIAHLWCALEFMERLLRGKGVSYAVMGGLALNIRGSRRDTHDVDIAADCDMLTVRQTCINEPRLVYNALTNVLHIH